MKFTQETWQKIDSHFDKYLDSSPEEQQVFLNQKWENEEISRELKKLISALGKDDFFIENPAFKPVKHFFENETDEFAGKKIGAYRLKKIIGRGGMSAVYLASRIDDFEKEVAVKIIPPFENRQRSAENFRRERQILAHLEHPNIARILDGGTTEENLPYIVMEFVDGVSLTEFCRQRNSVEREILELFLKVCQTVTFAHQNLIVHRDLKPNNILVTNDGNVKLLDFGIAKLLDSEKINFAENKTFDGNALTLEYASPEQINGENITVASDVYSLGVILYELLTGKRPHDFKDKSLAEIIKIIQTKESSAPSANSELDSIVLKSLGKNVDERYRTVTEFITDINNYLHNLPISARPNTFFYRTAKYVKRRKLETATAAVFVMVLVGWLVTVLVQAKFTETQAIENRRAAYSAEMILAASEYENANLNRLKELVEKYRNFDGEDLRGFEWHFLKNLLYPPSKIKSFPHSDEVWNVEFSPDGKFIATACNDNRVRIINLETGETVETAEQKGAWKVAFFPDGKRIAVAGSSNANPSVKIYDTANAAEILTFSGHTRRIRAIDVSPDGKTVVSGSQDGNILIWNAETGAEIKRFSFGTAPKGIEFYDVIFSNSGDKLAVLAFELFAVFDTKTWEKLTADSAKLLEKNISLTGWKMAFSPLEKTIAIGTFEGDVVFFDAETLAIIRVLKIHQANIKGLAFSPDGKILATGSWDRTVKFTDVQTGEIVNELRGHFAGVHEIAFSPDGKTLATASADFNVNLWDASQVLKENAVLMPNGVFTISEEDKNAYVWSGLNNSFFKYDLENKQKILEIKTDLNALSVSLSKESKQLAFGARNGFISIYDSETGTKIKQFRPSERTIYAIKFSKDGKIIYSAHEDGILTATNTETGTKVYEIKAHNEDFKALNLSHDGRFLATGGNDKIAKIYDAANGNLLQTLIGHDKPLYRTIFSNDDKLLVTTGADDVIKIWNISDGKLVRELSGTSAGVFAAVFSPDGKRLATASDVGVIRLWNIESGEQVLAFTASRKQITNLKFTADGKTLISFDASGKLSFWNGNY